MKGYGGEKNSIFYFGEEHNDTLHIFFKNKGR